MNMYSHRSGRLMSEISINGLKSRDWQGCAPSGGSRGESVSCLFKLQVVLAFSAHGCITLIDFWPEKLQGQNCH